MARFEAETLRLFCVGHVLRLILSELAKLERVGPSTTTRKAWRCPEDCVHDAEFVPNTESTSAGRQ